MVGFRLRLKEYFVGISLCGGDEVKMVFLNRENIDFFVGLVCGFFRFILRFGFEKIFRMYC